MITVYAVATVGGFVALVAWMLTHALGEGTARDPELRFGSKGRRLVAGVLGFGVAGLSAEYSALSIAWPVALLLAAAGAVLMAIVAERISATGEKV